MLPIHPPRSGRAKSTGAARLIGLATLILLCLTSIGLTKDADDASTRQARAAIDIFRRDFKSDNPEKRQKALAGLADHAHALVIDEIGKKALPDKDPTVRELAARILGMMKDLAVCSGPYLKSHLGKNEEHPEVQVAIIRAIRQLGYTEAGKELTAALSHCREEKYQFVVKEVIQTVETLGDKTLVLNLLALMKVRGNRVVRPDAPPAEECHSEATKAENMAKAKRTYERKHGAGRVKGKGKATINTVYWKRELDQAVKAMTGQTFDTPRDFEKWLKLHAAEFGLKKRDFRKIPKL